MMFRSVFWDVLPCKMIFNRRFRGAYHDNHFTRQYIPEDNSEQNLDKLRLQRFKEGQNTVHPCVGLLVGNERA
jgi:hypothetical protein